MERTKAPGHRVDDQSGQSVAGSEPGHPTFQLQQLVGNRATSQFLRGLAPQPSVTVSDDAGAEHEADRLADGVVHRMGQAVDRPAVVSGALSPALRTAVGSAIPGRPSLSRVRVRTDQRANQAADELGARAFTSGQEISVARGELSDGREGNRLLAHEAAHAALHQPVAATGLVHAKLRGTRDAILSKGGGRSSGKLRSLFKVKTNWDKICDALGVYEEMEGATLKGGNPTPFQMQAIAPRLIVQLQKIQALCDAWFRANQSDAEEKRSAFRQKTIETMEVAEADPRDKAERRQAIALLLPRVGLEINDLQSGRWTQGMGLSDTNKTSLGQSGEGAVNKVQELNYVTESGEFSGYFKEDKGLAGKAYQGHEADVGIHQMDPNYGARTVAMYRLDQLLGANVTAKAEFATHGGKVGTVLESAKGTEGAETKWAMDQEQARQRGPGAVLTSDPVLQRSLNKLQIFDAICGQLDRHSGNWYVHADPETGQVLGITGIDLDMSFGSDHKDPNKFFGENYLGLPEHMDAEFANRLLAIDTKDIRSCLTGLLSEPEIAATISRFEHVITTIREGKSTLVTSWDESTRESSRAQSSTARSGHKTYTSQVSGKAIDAALEAIKAAVQGALDADDSTGRFDYALLDVFKEMPSLSQRIIRDSFQYVLGYLVPRTFVWNGQLPAGQGVSWAIDSLNTALADSRLMAQLEVAVQENGESYASAAGAVQAILKPYLEVLVKGTKPGRGESKDLVNA